MTSLIECITPQRSLNFHTIPQSPSHSGSDLFFLLFQIAWQIQCTISMDCLLLITLVRRSINYKLSLSILKVVLNLSVGRPRVKGVRFRNDIARLRGIILREVCYCSYSTLPIS